MLNGAPLAVPFNIRHSTLNIQHSPLTHPRTIEEQPTAGPSFALSYRGGQAMRNEMIGAVVRRAIEHPEFRQRLVEDPQEALKSHGFVLESSDLAEIESIRTRLGQGDAEQQLVTIAEHYGVNPRP